LVHEGLFYLACRYAASLLAAFGMCATIAIQAHRLNFFGFIPHTNNKKGGER